MDIRRKLKSGHGVELLEGEELENLLNLFKSYDTGLIRLHPGKYLVPAPFTQFADKLYDFELRDTDVIIMTYPKCGTTWTQEIVWTMLNNPNFDNPMADYPTNARSPFMDADMLLQSATFKNSGIMQSESPFLKFFYAVCAGKNPEDGMFLQLAEMVPNPRILKCHLPFSLMPHKMEEKCKVVYVARNPKDVVMSYYHHSCLIKMQDYKGTFDQFHKLFIEDDLIYGPFWEHIKEGWDKREHPNVHFLFYEDIKADPVKEIEKLNVFLKTALTPAQIEKVKEYTSFSAMKKRGEVAESSDIDKEMMNLEVLKKDGGFFRKGVSGSWRGKLTSIQESKIDFWTKKNTLGLGLKFKYG